MQSSFKKKKMICEKENKFLMKITVLEPGSPSAEVCLSYSLSLALSLSLVVRSLVPDLILGISYALCSLPLFRSALTFRL